jgi:hypothetical protein
VAVNLSCDRQLSSGGLSLTGRGGVSDEYGRVDTYPIDPEQEVLR